jgi:hemoglobin-like flavoprotein
MVSVFASQSAIVAAATAYHLKQMEALEIARKTGDRVTEDHIMYDLRKEHMTGCIAKHILDAAQDVIDAEKKYEEAIDEFDQAKGMLKYLCSVHRDAFD